MTTLQWVGKPFWVTLSTLSIVSLFGFFLYDRPPVAATVVVLAGITTLGLTVWRLPIGLYILIAEVLAFSHGHLFDAIIGGQRISLRMAIWMGVMLGWGIALLLRRVSFSWRDTRLFPWLLMLVAVSIGWSVGVQNRPISVVHADANAYAYLLLIGPVLSVRWTSLEHRQILQILIASAMWVGIFGLVVLFLFTHAPEPWLRDVYRAIRDTRVAEVTLLSGGLYRVFLPSQWTVAIVGLLFGSWVWMRPRLDQKDRFLDLGIFVLLGSGIVLSLSRSFWVGLIAGVACLALWIGRRVSFRVNVQRIGFALIAGALAVIFLLLVAFFPYPSARTQSGDLASLQDRFDLQDAAISSRWNLWTPLWQAVGDRPLFGHGFGAEVSFVTDDPFFRELFPSGEVTTSAFEWGWLDAWVKMGVLGPIAFLYAIGYAIVRLTKQKEAPDAWLLIGLAGVLVTLAVTHAFSPYLNHPLGLVTLLIAYVFLSPGSRVLASQPSVEPAIRAPYPRTNSAAVMTDAPSS